MAQKHAMLMSVTRGQGSGGLWRSQTAMINVLIPTPLCSMTCKQSLLVHSKQQDDCRPFDRLGMQCTCSP